MNKIRSIGYKHISGPMYKKNWINTTHGKSFGFSEKKRNKE
jgi:hypothetical protein